MAIYKVHIKTEGYRTTYRTNDTTLATVTYSPELNKWSVSAPHIEEQANTPEGADKVARENITALFATWGIVPEFING